MKNMNTIAGVLLILASGAVPGYGADIDPKSASAPTAIEEKFRNDPLMMPYYTGHILPTPQKVEYRDEFLPLGNVAIVVGKDVVNPDPLVGVLMDRIVRYGGKATGAPA